MVDWRVIEGEALEELGKMPDESVHCVVTSPPYWGLRDYGDDRQIGLEVDPFEFVRKLVAVFSEVRRVLDGAGTLWLNLGDTYLGGRNGGIGSSSVTSQRNQIASRKAWVARGGPSHRTAPGLKAKDMAGVPWRVALALQADGWWLRCDIIWAKPSPMPEAVYDRPTKAHEYIFLLTKSARYHYDADAIKEPVTGGAKPRGHGINPKAKVAGAGVRQNPSFSAAVRNPVERRNKRSVWTVAQQPFSEAHFATFPPRLVEPCIKAGCPEGGLVLDPFAGAGTAGMVAVGLGRDFIGIELNPEYCAMARRRIVEALERRGEATVDDAVAKGRPTQLGLLCGGRNTRDGGQ